MSKARLYFTGGLVLVLLALLQLVTNSSKVLMIINTVLGILLLVLAIIEKNKDNKEK